VLGDLDLALPRTRAREFLDRVAVAVAGREVHCGEATLGAQAGIDGR